MLESLLNEYQQTLQKTEKQKKQIEAAIEQWEAQKTGMLKEEALKIDEELTSLYYDKKIVNSIISDLEYSIKWMKTGRQPGPKRGIERRAAYQREKPFDPIVMQRFHRSSPNAYVWDNEPKEQVVSRSERDLIQKALASLTEKEREVYLMARGQSLSQRDIASRIGISRSTVKVMLKRSDQKIGKVIQKEREKEAL